MVTLEQVEKLKEKANVSYEDAKAALEFTNGDLLDAVIYLERQGKIQGPKMHSYNTNTGGGRSEEEHNSYENQQWQAGYEYKQRRKQVHRQRMQALKKKAKALLRKGNRNHLVVLREGVESFRISITLLALAIVCFFWVTVPLLIIGLFCDCAYQFQGPDFGKAGINSIMDQAAETAESIKNAVMAEKENVDEDEEIDLC